MSDEYKKWGKLSMHQGERLSGDAMETASDPELDKRRKQYATDHTQVLYKFQQFIWILPFIISN